MPALNGTSFDFVTTENGPVSLDLYSTPQYKRDQHGDCTGELCFVFSTRHSESRKHIMKLVGVREEDAEDSVR